MSAGPPSLTAIQVIPPDGTGPTKEILYEHKIRVCTEAIVAQTNFRDAQIVTIVLDYLWPMPEYARDIRTRVIMDITIPGMELVATRDRNRTLLNLLALRLPEPPGE